MAVYLTSIAAQNAGRVLRNSSVGMQQTLEQINGNRRNEATGPKAPAGQGTAEEVRVASQGRRNAMDGAAFLQVASGVLQDVEDLLERAAGLTRQAQNKDLNDQDRAALGEAFQGVQRSLKDVGAEARFNGAPVFNGRPMSLPLRPGQSYTVQPPPLDGGPDAPLTQVLGASLEGPDSAAAARIAVEDAQAQVRDLRANLQKQWEEIRTLGNALGIQAENLSAVGTAIQDVRIADEVVGLAKLQITERSELRALGQVPSTRQQVLDLLR